MPKAILEFNLPEENMEFKTATRGSEMAGIIWDFDMWLRQQVKYEAGEMTKKQAQIARDKLYELMKDREVTFDSEIFQ